MRLKTLAAPLVLLAGWAAALPAENGGPGGIFDDYIGNPSYTKTATATPFEFFKGGPTGLGTARPTKTKNAVLDFGPAGMKNGPPKCDDPLIPLTSCYTSFAPARTSAFPYDSPPLKLQIHRLNGNNGTMTDGAYVTEIVTATPTLAAGGAMESLMQALNVEIPTPLRSLLPTEAPQFEDAANEIVHLIGGRQMRGLPLELEVSPGHMGAVRATIQRLNNLELDGSQRDTVNIYLAWTVLLDELLLPPSQKDSISWSEEDLRRSWYSLYQAYYMARVRSTKISLSHQPRNDSISSGDEIDKSWTMFLTHWEIKGRHLNEVNRKKGHDTESPGHGLHKRISECGATTAWHYTDGAQEVLQCPQGFLPYGPKTPVKGDKEQIKKAKEKKKHPYSEFSIFPIITRPDGPQLTDLGTDIHANEPLPPEQDDEHMTWWTNVGHSGCRPDMEQAAAEGDYDKAYGDAISHQPRVCYQMYPERWKGAPVTEPGLAPGQVCAGSRTDPQNSIVKRNGTNYLHINFYAWKANAETRIAQLVADKYRRDTGEFMATFQLPVGMEHCVKKKLHEMGWTEAMEVENQTNWAVFTFEILSTIILSVLPMWGLVGAALGGAAAGEAVAGAALEGAELAAAEAAGEMVVLSAAEGGGAAVVPAAAARSLNELLDGFADGTVTSETMTVAEKEMVTKVELGSKAFRKLEYFGGDTTDFTNVPLRYAKKTYTEKIAFAAAQAVAKEVASYGAA